MKRRTQPRTRVLLALMVCIAALSCASPPDARIAKCLTDLNDAHWQVRASAAEELGRYETDRSIAPLRAALGDDSGEVRSAALTSLGRLRAGVAKDDIRARLHDDKDQQV